jgi:hypothetical protein
MITRAASIESTPVIARATGFPPGRRSALAWTLKAKRASVVLGSSKSRRAGEWFEATSWYSSRSDQGGSKFMPSNQAGRSISGAVSSTRRSGES